MNERPLPDDLSKWPEDPNELLGVSFGISPRELRRAYNRLIRTYKPEQYPEQFRRIREAYEYLLRIAEMFSRPAETVDSPAEKESISHVPKEPANDDVSPEWTAGNPRPVEEPSEEEIIPAPARPPEDELAELWETAIAGRPSPAYKRLVGLTQQYAGRVDFYQRLYWLLTLWPDLDSQRVAADWLVEGMLATGLAGPLRELYREVVADAPAEAISERYERLLETTDSPERLADLIEGRFQAAMRLQRWDVLNADLSRFGSRFGIGKEQLWLRLLFLLADGAAWAIAAQGEQLLKACRKEIARYEHLASQVSYLYDRFDLLLETSAGWRKLSRRDGFFTTIWRLLNTSDFSKFIRRPIPTNILRLIGVGWFRPFAEVRELLIEVLEAIVAAPEKWVKHLDQMRKRAPATLALFGELLNQFEAEHNSGELRDRNRLSEIVLPFLSGLNVAELANYETARKRLLLFCIRENINPEEMAEVSSGWAQELMTDWPLRYVCRACRLFWA